MCQYVYCVLNKKNNNVVLGKFGQYCKFLLSEKTIQLTIERPNNFYIFRTKLLSGF